MKCENCKRDINTENPEYHRIEINGRIIVTCRERCFLAIHGKDGKKMVGK